VRFNEKATFQRNLLRWYRSAKRPLPWRKTRDPYKILISEMLLQQTRVETAIDYYNRFVRRFPTVKHLSEASQESVLQVWQGLGYYGRARNLHRTAQLLCMETKGRIPSDPEALQKFPGIGPYTAAAVASIAFGRDVPVLDGNVVRVLCRVFMIRDDPGSPATRKRLVEIGGDLLPKGKAADFNQALMEIGALVCKPARPDCLPCPVKSVCAAFKKGKTHLVPLRRKKPPVPIQSRVVAFITGHGRILISKRPTDGLLGGLWELPGRTAEIQETEKQARRKLESRLRKHAFIQPVFSEPCAVLKHTYSHFQEELRVYRYKGSQSRPGDQRRKGHPDWKWVHRNRISQYPVTGATKKILQQIDG